MNTIFERFVIEGEKLNDLQEPEWGKVRAFPKFAEARDHLKTIGNHDPSKMGYQRYRVVNTETGQIIAEKECFDRNGRKKARALAAQYRQISKDLGIAANAKTQQERIVLTREIVERLGAISWA